MRHPVAFHPVARFSTMADFAKTIAMRNPSLIATLLAACPFAWGDTQLPAVNVVAQGDPNGKLDLDDTVATGSRLGLTVRQTPAAVTVVNKEQIEAREARDTQEIARAIPGVTNSSPPGSAGSISYRGFSGSQITQLFNGISVQYDVIAARPVDSWIYDRVEAIGGPSAFLFGAGAVGGSVNYLTKTAERSPVSELQVRLGSFNTRQYSFGINRQIAGDSAQDGHFLRLDMNSRNSDGWVDGNKSRSQQVATSLLSDLAPGLTHLLALEYQNEHVDRPYWGTPLLTSNGTVSGSGRILDGTRFKNYNAADGLYEQTVKWARSVLEWKPSAEVSLKNTLYHYDALRDYRNVEVYRFNASNSAVIRSSPLLQRHDQNLKGDRIEALLKSDLLGLPSTWALGLDYSVNTQTRFPNSLNVNVSTVNPYDFATENFFSIPGMSPGFNADRTVKITTLALSVENQTRLRPDLSLVSALRHDQLNLDLTNHRTVTASSPAGYSRDYSPTTGRIGLVWDFARNASAYVQYATAADPPSGILATASFADVMTNDKLTTGRQWEAGSKFDYWDGRGNATAALYRITRKNISTPDPGNPNVSILVGQQSAWGVELASGLKLTNRLSVQANLALIDPRYDDFFQTVNGVALSRAGKIPTNTPRQVFNLWTDYALTPSLKLSAGARQVGKVYADAANTVSAPGYTIYDLGFSYRIDRTLSLGGRIRNLTDKVYAANVTGTPMYYLGEPRSADLTLRYGF